jgi:YGGT family
LLLLSRNKPAATCSTEPKSALVDKTFAILPYWYYHLPNFILAALMYTLLGRVLLSMFLDADSTNYIWRFFCRVTDPVVAAVAFVTPREAPTIVLWLFGFVWLFWLRVLLLNVFLASGAVPRVG